MVVTMKALKNLALFVIIAVAMVISGYAAFEVLTQHVGISAYLALAAAIVIDAAALWLGHHAVVLAKLGDSTTKVQLATWFMIAISLGVNFLHGYLAGGWIGGCVGIIYPLIAALLFHFFIAHTIRETLRSRGRILPEKPLVSGSRKYRDKARHVALQKDYVALTYDMAEDNLRQQRDKLKTDETKPLHVSQAIDTSETAQRYNETSNETAETTSDTSETDVARQIETVLDGIETPEDLVSLPDYLSPGMNTPMICRLLVDNDVRDIDTAVRYVNILNEDSVSRATVRQNMSRATKKLESETK
jgi:hypothetical protein